MVPFRRYAPVVPFLLCTSMVIGYLACQVEASALLVGSVYGFIAGSMLWTVRKTDDWFNPLTLIVVLSWLRFSVPWGLFAFEQPPLALRLLRLGAEDWQYGHLLALFGMLCLVLGWLSSPPNMASTIQRGMEHMAHDLRGHTLVLWSCLIYLLGLIGLFVFIRLNTTLNFASVVSSGIFRSTAIQEGTGVFFYLAHAAIAGSALLTSYLAIRYKQFRFSLTLPTAFAAAAFFILAGRARSFTPIGCALFIFWHTPLRRNMRLRYLLGLVALVIFAMVFAYAGATYRGTQGGLEGLAEAFTLENLLDYVRHAAWVDSGQLHALAGAANIGPGVLHGRTFVAAFGKISHWLGLEGQSAGVFIVDMLIGRGKVKWGFNAGFIGDAYLNFGLWPTLLLCGLFGAWLRNLYRVSVRMSENPLGLAFCAINVIYSLRLFFDSVEETFELLVIWFFLLSGPLLIHGFRKEPARPRGPLGRWST